MGTRVTKSGFSVQFCDRKGNITGKPIFSRYVRLLGQPRSDVIKRTGPLTKEERSMKGSDDWLTLIAIADSKARLNRLVRKSNLPNTDAQTSGSSRRVRVALDIGGRTRTYRGRITIASGPIVQHDPPIMNVNFIKVLGKGAAMNKRHPLKQEFVAQTPVR